MGQEYESRRTATEDILRKTNSELTYDGAGNLIGVVETDVLTGKIRISTLAYDGAGNLISVSQS